MLFDPAEWISDFMDLTEMSLNFEWFLLLLAGLGFVVAYIAERRVFPPLAKMIGSMNKRFRPSRQAKRKMYKEIIEDMN